MAATSDANAAQIAKPKEGRLRFDVEVEGICLPQKRFGKVRSVADHVQQIRQMNLRADDVFLLSYPKTGTHWLWEICFMLRQGKADYDRRSKVQLMMEFVDVETLDAQPSPRILNTHLPFFMLPVQEMRNKQTKLVHLYRNIKDAIVSMYFMAKSGNFAMGSLPLDEFVEYYLSDKAPFGGFFSYLRQMHEFIEANPDMPVLTVCYEDMKTDPVTNIRRLSEFLEVDASEQLCQDIAQACSFHRMKEFEKQKEVVHFGGDDTSDKVYIKHKRGDVQDKSSDVSSSDIDVDNNKADVKNDGGVDSKNGGANNKDGDVNKEKCDVNNMERKEVKKEGGIDVNKSDRPLSRRADIYRKGEVGDWKNHLTVAMSERVDAFAMEKMKGLPFILTYE